MDRPIEKANRPRQGDKAKQWKRKARKNPDGARVASQYRVGYLSAFLRSL